MIAGRYTCSVMFIWGGAFVGFYTLMPNVVECRFQGAALAATYAAMGLTWSGALVGSSVAGLAVDVAPHGPATSWRLHASRSGLPL